MINSTLCLYIVVNIFIIALNNKLRVLILQITDIEYVLGNKKESLEDLSKKFKISRERIRQIENKAFEKLQKHMLLLAKSKNLLPVN